MSPAMAKTTVIYNDSCPICSREVAAYRREADRAGVPVRFEGLDPEVLARHGLDRETAAKRFHVVEDGALLSGVDAFAALWERLPRWAWLARVVRLPGVRGVAGLAYDRLAAPALYAMDRRRRR